MILRKIRRLTARPHTVATLAASLLLSIHVSGCGDAVIAPDSRVAANAIPVHVQPWAQDGRSLYRGIFFGEGGITAGFPELQDGFSWRSSLTPQQTSAYQSMVADFVDAIDQLDPGFFSTFNLVMRSGDHQRIAQQLERAGALTLTAASSVPDVAAWQTALAANQHAAQAEILRLQNAGEITPQDADDARAALALMIAVGSPTNTASTTAKAGWWRGWALGLAVAVAVAVVYPPLVGVAVAVVVAYAWAYAWSSVATANDLERDQTLHAFATRLASHAPIPTLEKSTELKAEAEAKDAVLTD